jgi:hypothetical protein
MNTIAALALFMSGPAHAAQDTLGPFVLTTELDPSNSSCCLIEPDLQVVDVGQGLEEQPQHIDGRQAPRHSQLLEDRVLFRRQQRPGPLDGGPHRAVPIGHAAGGGRDIQPVTLQVCSELRHREHVGASRSDLDRERHAAEDGEHL